MNARALKRFVPGGRWAVIAVPFLWLLLFFAIPFLIVLKISFAKLAIAIVENPMLNGQCLRLDAGQRFAPK